MSEPWTVMRLLDWTADYLRDHDSTSPRLDAEVLLAEARGCRRIDLYTAFDEVADERVRTTYRELVRRRAEGTPVAYLVGHREFYSTSFRVTPDVLIPRPETELIVVTLLDLVKSYRQDRPLRIADIGTGSGILAICAALHIQNCTVTAVDISSAALDVARKNANDHEVAEKIELVESDLFAGIPAGEPFDFIMSNPPYVSQDEYNDLPVDVREQEPRTALLAGPTGMEVIDPLILQASDRLAPGGWLLMELSPMIAETVEMALQAHPQFVEVTLAKDLAGHGRVIRARRIE